MTGLSVEASLLERARRASDSLDARLFLAAAVQRVALGVGARSVVTGGTAVDFYAAGATGTSEALPLKWESSGDVDLVVLSVDGWGDLKHDVLAALSARLGLQQRFAGIPRVVDVPDFPYGLELVGSELNGDPKGERVFTVLLEGEHPISFRGPEDVILAYAESGWHMRHTRDWERALAVYAAMKDRVDLPWLVREAERRRKGEVLRAVMGLQPSPWRTPRREDD